MTVAALAAWADMDTSQLAVTRFALVVLAASALATALSFLCSRRVSDAEPTQRALERDDDPSGAQLRFAGFDDA